MGTLSRGCIHDPRFTDGPVILTGSSENHIATANLRGEESPAVECDYFGGVYEYIKQMLMEEDDLEHRPCMFQDCSALQAAEKYFYDALISNNSNTRPPPPSPPPFSVINQSPVREENYDFSISASELPLLDSHGALSCDLDSHFRVVNSSANESAVRVVAGDEGRCCKKIHDRGDNGNSAEEKSNNKQFASYAEDDSVQMEKYDKSLLCPKMNPEFYNESPIPNSDDKTSDDSEEENKKQYRKTKEVKRGRPKGTKKNRTVKEVVDLSSLLTRCAEAVSNFNISTSEKLLKQIRSHSSLYGDANERLAHCFANALEARMAGTGSALYTAFASRRIPAAELLRSYQAYVTACPFKRMSNIFANKSIGRYTREAMRIHIIDFGILYGFQWPCIIQGLSLRPGGPPRLKITGIDFPQPGFKPAERVEQTGRRLVDYCKRFNVPFEYNAIAKKWDEIRIEDLKLERDGMVVVNCLYRLRHVPDESSSAGVNSPRDAVLKLIRKINPDLFVHGVVNGAYDAPFFATRFREAMFHYSSFFDMLEATLPREDQDRLLYEREVFGRDVMNVVACEGLERIERPETYKKWQVRNQRAGFVQMPLYREIVKEVKSKVREDYHNDFLLDEDSEWMLQGWKGRVMYALSCWKPLEG